VGAAFLLVRDILAMRRNANTDADKLITFGQMALEQGWSEQAREYFEQALALDASNREAMKGLARVNEILSRKAAMAVEPTRTRVEPTQLSTEETRISHEGEEVHLETQKKRIKVALGEYPWLVGISAAIAVIILLGLYDFRIVAFLLYVGLAIGAISFVGWVLINFGKWQKKQLKTKQRQKPEQPARERKPFPIPIQDRGESLVQRYTAEIRDPTLAQALAKSLRAIMEGGVHEVDKQWLAQYKTLDQLNAMTPREFEEFVARMFRAMGHSVTLTQAAKDKGVDIFLDGGKAIVECKKYGGSVGQPVVRDFYGTMIHNRAERGYIVTTGTFSLPAQTWAAGKPIHLVDGMEIVKNLETFEVALE
jgi:restriction system protein